MTTKRIVSLLAGSAIVAILLLAVVGAKPAWPSYRLDGTWYGTTKIDGEDVPWIASYSSSVEGQGTCVVEAMGRPIGRGVWERTARKTFRYTVLAYVPGNDGGYGEESGTIKMTSPDNMEFEACAHGPGVPCFPCFGTGTRLRVEDPCSPQQ